MKTTKYQLKNSSLTNGQYKVGGDWKVLKPSEVKILTAPPTAYTKNVIVQSFAAFDSNTTSVSDFSVPKMSATTAKAVKK